MDIQQARQILGKQEVTTDDLWKLLHKNPTLFHSPSLSTFDKINQLLTREAVMHEYELDELLSLVETFGEESFHRGQESVTDDPESYGLYRVEEHDDL